jgi:hypothetical protein
MTTAFGDGTSHQYWTVLFTSLKETKCYYTRWVPNSNKSKFNSTGKAIPTLPTPLQKTSVKHSKKNVLWLIDTGTFEGALPQETYDSIYEYIDCSVTQNHWCYDNIEVPNDYRPLLQDIKNGNTYMVNDGSFHPTNKCGTAAWIIEGKTSK